MKIKTLLQQKNRYGKQKNQMEKKGKTKKAPDEKSRSFKTNQQALQFVEIMVLAINRTETARIQIRYVLQNLAAFHAFPHFWNREIPAVLDFGYLHSQSPLGLKSDGSKWIKSSLKTEKRLI